MQNISSSGDINRPQQTSDSALPKSIQQVDKGGGQSKSVDQPATKTPEYVRSLNSQDISQALLNLQKAVTPENKQILTTMLLYGVETSPEAFDLVEQAVKGSKKGNKLEASVIAYSKGLNANSKAVDLISKFLSHNMQFSRGLASLSSGLNQLKNGLSGFNAFLDPSLVAGVAGFLDDFIEDTKGLKKHADNLDIKGLFSKQTDLIQDLRYLKDFFKGIEKKLSSSNNLIADNLKEVIKKVEKQATEFHDVLLTQLILSKSPGNQQIAEEFFHYWMIPNPMATKAKDIQIMVSKDPKNKKKINPYKTKIVMKCETSDLGDLTIIIEIDDKKMAYKIYTSSELTKKFVIDEAPELKKSMEAMNYEVTTIQALKKVINIEKLLLPTVNLNTIKRISTEV
tara:strand:- start:1569 stop:2759 length:1191 start_codon:yes stop_codon:yes gene_type:complete